MAIDLSVIEQRLQTSVIDFLLKHGVTLGLMIGVVLAAVLISHFVRIIYIVLNKKFGEKYGFPVSEGAIKVMIYGIAFLLILVMIPTVSTNILQLFGLFIGLVVAFSSSTLIANGMAGVMIKIIKPYGVGDVMKVKGYFGKVYHIGLLHTEIQTPHREIVNVPNLLSISEVVVNYTEGDYLVNVTVNLGYEVSRSLAEKLLLEAVERTKLKQGFVLMKDLGSFGVDYEVNGLLDHEDRLIQKESELRKNIFDVFYENNVQIMTPTYMTTRELYRAERVLPEGHKRGPRRGVQHIEKVMFEKATEEIERKEKEAENNNKESPKRRKH